MQRKMASGHTTHSTQRVQAGRSGRAPIQIRLPGGNVEDSTRARLSRQMARTEVCHFWPRCRRGDQCSFAHGAAELRSRPDFRKTSLCANWQAGVCALTSATCAFAHGRSEMRMTDAFKLTSTRRWNNPVQQHPGALPPPRAAPTAFASSAPLPQPLPPPLPSRLMSSETSTIQAPGASHDTTSRGMLPFQHSSFAEHSDAEHALLSFVAGQAGIDRAAPVFEFDGSEERDSNHTKPACPSVVLRTSNSQQAQTGARVGESQPSSSAHNPGSPHVADPILHAAHAGPLLGTTAQGPLGEPPTVRSSFEDTLVLLSTILQHVAEGHEASVSVSVRL